MRAVEMPHVFITCFAWSNFDHIAKGAVVGRGFSSKYHSGSQEYLGGMLPLYILFSPPCRPKERGSQFSALLAARGSRCCSCCCSSCCCCKSYCSCCHCGRRRRSAAAPLSRKLRKTYKRCEFGSRVGLTQSDARPN